MTEDVYLSLKNILTRRKRLNTEMFVDGYSNFLLLDKDDKSKVVLHIESGGICAQGQTSSEKRKPISP